MLLLAVRHPRVWRFWDILHENDVHGSLVLSNGSDDHPDPGLLSRSDAARKSGFLRSVELLSIETRCASFGLPERLCVE